MPASKKLNFNNRRCYIIPEYTQYGITADGSVMDIKSSNSIDWICDENGIPFVTINDAKISIPRLLVDVFIGHLDLPIMSYNGNTWHNSNDLTYCYQSCAQISDDEFSIDGIRFKRIPIFPAYAISENGVVFNLQTKKFMHHTWDSQNYAYILLRSSPMSGKRKRIFVAIHRLVYCTYNGPLDPDLIVDHKDNVWYHNHYTNLQQITIEDNTRKSYNEGHNIDKLKWSDAQIHAICKLMEKNIPIDEIASKLNIDNVRELRTLCSRLRRNYRRQNISALYNLPPVDDGRRDDELIHTLCKLIESDKRPSDILDEVSLPHTQANQLLISKLKYGRAYRRISCMYDLPYNRTS